MGSMSFWLNRNNYRSSAHLGLGGATGGEVHLAACGLHLSGRPHPQVPEVVPQGLLFWLLLRALQAAGGIEAVRVLTSMFLK